jgi:hypothetical protein
MCKSNITLKKFLKLVLEFYFYKLIISSIFWIAGYADFSLKELIKVLIPIRTLNDGFTGNFFVFFLTIPFINILLKNASEKQHILLIILSLFVYCFFETIPGFSVNKNYFSWFMVLYFISSYIRLYPKKFFERKNLWFVLSMVSILLSIISVVACTWLSTKGFLHPYKFVQDSNTFLALTNGVTTFLWFRNIKIKPNKFINTVAMTMFCVLCIHANSGTIRQFLWNDLFNNAGAYSYPWLPLDAIVTVLIVFVSCVIIDLIRINFIEKPFFNLYDKLEGKLIGKYKKFEDKVCEKYNIQG